MRANFLERSLAGILHAMEHAAASERTASSRGLLQRLDARVKLAGLLALIAATAVARNLATLLASFALALALALLSRVPMTALAKAWAAVILFSGAIVLPALFTTPGTAITRVGSFSVTAQGLRSAEFLIGRVTATTTLAFLLVATTPWPHLIAALRSIRLPAAVVLVVAMTYRYVFVLLRSAEEMFVARRSRTMGALAPPQRRQVATATAGVLLGRAIGLSDDVYLAMRARGFRGEVRLLETFAMRGRDWLAGAAFAAAFTAVLWSGLR